MGNLVEIAVGDFVGDPVGLIVGNPEPVPVGLTVRDSVGDREGVDVGTPFSSEKGFPCTVYWSSF